MNCLEELYKQVRDLTIDEEIFVLKCGLSSLSHLSSVQDAPSIKPKPLVSEGGESCQAIIAAESDSFEAIPAGDETLLTSTRLLEQVSSRFIGCEERIAQLYDHMTGQKKGKNTELYVLRQLCDYMPDARICHVGSEGHEGDLFIEVEECGKPIKILIECKNYSAAVPKGETDKFYRDMQECVNDVKIGIFIAVGARVEGKKEFDIERSVSTGQLMCFLSGVDVLNIQSISVVVRALVEMAQQPVNDASAQISQSVDMMKDYQKTVDLYCQYTAKHLQKTKQSAVELEAILKSLSSLSK